VIATRIAGNRRARLLGIRGARTGTGRDGLLLGALLWLGLGAVGPRCGIETVRIPASGVDVVLLFDVSRSMLARDVAPNRLLRARRAADELLADLTEADRVALAAYAGRGLLLTPLTPDKEALRALLAAVDPGLLTTGGSRLGEGVEAAARAFDTADPRPRVVVVLGDGEDPERGRSLGLEAARHARMRVVAAAFGSAAGAPVPAQTGTLTDARGRPVVSRAHPERLAELAEGTGGRILETDAGGRLDRAALLAAVRRDAPRAGAGFVERQLPVLRSDLCALLALALLCAESARLLPALRRRASPGLVAVAGALLLGATTAPDREAEEPAALLREGVERATRGELEEAEHAFFAALALARDPAVAADAYYDLGVAALARRDYEAARSAFFDSLALRPGDRETQFNLEWTLLALESAPLPQPNATTRPEDTAPESEPEPSEREAEPRRGEPQRADEPETDEERGERQRADAERDPDAHPERSRHEGAKPRRNPVELDPEAAERWLTAVEDDPKRSLQTGARGEPKGARRTEAPTW
jgi:Ca-activated chloride channel family protein